jgi:hypothetical protein
MFKITEITEFDFCQLLNCEFGGGFVYLVFICSYLDALGLSPIRVVQVNGFTVADNQT